MLQLRRLSIFIGEALKTDIFIQISPMYAIITENILRSLFSCGILQTLIPQQRLTIRFPTFVLSIKIIVIKPNLNNFHLLPPFQNTFAITTQI